MQLDKWLPSLKDEQFTVRTTVIEGRVVEVYGQWVSAPFVLDWLRDRRSAREMLAKLAPVLAMDCSTPAQVCRRWQALATWTPRFERDRDGKPTIHFGAGVAESRTFGGVSSPYREWAIAFRDATTAVLPLMRDREDVPVHRLLQDLDEVLQGKVVHLAEHLREVAVLVRASLSRAATSPKQEPPTATDQPSDPIARWYAVRTDWGMPRDERGYRPLLINWHTWKSLDTAVLLVEVIQELLPQARAANPDYVMPLLSLQRHVREGLFQTKDGREPTIALLSQVDLIIADLKAIETEKNAATAAASRNSGVAPPAAADSNFTSDGPNRPHDGDRAPAHPARVMRATKVTKTPKQRSIRNRKGNKTARRRLSDMAVLVLRVLPDSGSPALRTLDAITRKVDLNPRPSISSISRAVKELRVRPRPLADPKSYRATEAGERERAKHQ